MIWFVDGSSPGPLVSKRVNAIFTLFESIEGSGGSIVHLEFKQIKRQSTRKTDTEMADIFENNPFAKKH